MTFFLRSTLMLALLCGAMSAQAGVIEFTSATFTGSEATTPALITVGRSGDTSTGATVQVSTSNGTATAGSDYTATTVTLSWAIGDAANKTVSIPILNDRLVEGTETVVLTLSAVTGDTLGATSMAILSIEDFEEGTLAFGAATYEVAENAGSITVPVLRTNGSDGAVTVNYATVNGTATAPAFFTAKSGTLTFADGETSKDISISIIDNAVGQPNRNFRITLSTVTGGAVLGERISTTITIINDDADFTPGLTQITPIRPNVTQGNLLSLSQASPFNATNTLLATLNRIPELTITGLVAAQAGTGVVSIVVGKDTYHLLPYTATLAGAGSNPAIFVDQGFSVRMITDEGLQFNLQPALIPFEVLQFALNAMQIPKSTVTQHGNITIQKDQGPPLLDLDSSGKLVINNRFYDRYNLRPSIVSSVAAPGSAIGVYLQPHPDPHPALSKEVFLQVVYTAGTETRQQHLMPAPAIAAEYISGLMAIAGVSNVQLQEFGMSSFTFNDRVLRMYADIIVRRVNPTTFTGPSPQQGLFGAGDLNGDGTDDFRMVYSNGDEQYFYLLP
jgi:hypothetical protein